MPLTFPVAASGFFGLLPIARAKFYVPEVKEINQSGAGEVFQADLGPRLWTGQVTLQRRPHAVLAPHEARISLMQQAGASFMVYDPRRSGPAYDPTGVILGSSSVVINSLASNARELTLSGLPAGYVISPGDYLGWTYGSSPLRYALHRVVVGRTANGSGVTGQIEVSPYIRAGATTGTAVSLLQPVCKAMIIPNSVVAPEGGQVMSEGLSFSFIQTLR